VTGLVFSLVAWYITGVENDVLAGVRTEATSLPAEEVIRLSLRPSLGDLVIGPLAGREKDEEMCPPRRDRRWVIC